MLDADKPHVLVVDDDQRICALVSRYLQEQDFVVMTAFDAAQARALVESFSFDVLVVDVMMPGETGLEFTQALRKENKTPVLLLTALGEAMDRIAGLEAGADDYLPKPFEPRELVLRLQAILRRTGHRPGGAQALKVGRWIFQSDGDELRDGDTAVRLTAAEANLLRALAKTPGVPLSREALAADLGIAAGDRTIDVQITRLRRKLEDDTKAPRIVQTVRGKGYLLRAGEA